MNNDWKNEIVIKRRCQSTSLFIFETVDKKRIDQLKDFINTKYGTYFKNKTLEKKISIDVVDGITDLDTGKEIEIKSDNPFQGKDFISSLKTAETMLKSKKMTAVIITGITSQQRANSISELLQNWAYNDTITESQSTIIVVVPDASLFDEHTRRYAVIIQPPFSTESERKDIFESVSVALDDIQYDRILPSLAGGLTQHDLESAIYEGVFRNKGKEINFESITKAKMDMIKRHGYEMIYPTTDWSHIGGYSTVKDYIKNNIIKILKDPTAREWKIGTTRGILFFGIGGCGKTVFTKAMAKELSIPLISVNASDFFASLVGESERKTKQLMRIAEENSPAITFFDEIDAIGGRREEIGNGDSGVSRRVLNMLLQYLGDEERKSIIVGATNLIQQLDTALLRSGRFDTKIPIFPPDFDARKEIINVHTKIVRNMPVKINVEELAEKTFLYTGAEIELLCTEAGRIALVDGKREITQEHFKKAFDCVFINMEKRESEFKDFLRIANEFSSNRNLLREQMKEFTKKEKSTSRLDTFKKEMGME